MRIAVIEHVEAGDYAEYISSLINERAKQNNYQIKTWSNSVPAFQQQVAGDAVIYIYIESKSPLLLSWLYNVKIPSILKKTRAEVVVDLNGIASDKIKISQFIVGAESFFHNNAKHLNNIEKFAFKHLKDSVKIAKNIFAYSKRNLNVENIKQDLLQPIPFTAPAIFKTFEWHDKLMVKAQHADNKEFFIAVIEDNNVDDFVLLLQAFSKFKKWQQSSMQLLVFAKYESLGEDILAKHKTYKYCDDVRLIEDVEEKQMAAIIASAYALIHVAENKPDLLMIAVALQCSLPIISSENNDVKEYAGDAALYCNEKTPEAFAQTLIQLYKDENLHAQLKEKTQQQSVLLKREECENKLWMILEASAHS
jgi:glycosyltransferase involved in cell wall biosynthesis